MSANGFRWRTERNDEPVTLETMRAFVAEVAKDLDPGSRYVSELLAVLDASQDVDDYMRRLYDPSKLAAFQKDGSVPSNGERGRSWVDAETWKDMDPFEQTLSNLLTGETRMMWAGEGAQNFAALGDVLAGLNAPRRVLSVPCSIGKEPFSIAIAALRAGVEGVEVVGVDRQEAYVERARTGILVPHHRDQELDDVGDYLAPDRGRLRVSEAVLGLCSFTQGDVLTGELPGGPFGLVSCRNLLGYFRGESLELAVTNVCARVRPGGVLLVDGFVTDSSEMARAPELFAELGFTRRAGEGTHYYDKAS